MAGALFIGGVAIAVGIVAIIVGVIEISNNKVSRKE
jgi:hypothetical protein